MSTRTLSLAAALVALSIAQEARADFARPPEEPESPNQVVVDSGYRYEEEPEYRAHRSTVRLHVGPALLFSPATPGLFGALDLGRRAVGARFSAAWLGAEHEGGLSQYGGELWVDFADGSEIHPIAGAGAALIRSRDENDDAHSLGAGTLRGSLEYELPVRDAEARIGLTFVGLLPAIDSERKEPWVMGAITVGAGF